MRRPRHKLQISTFPFLAVLLGAMGSLIFLLMVMDRRAKIVARNKVRDAQQVRLAASQSADEQRRADWERQRLQFHAMLASRHRQISGELDDALSAANRTGRQLQFVSNTHAQLQTQIDAERDRLKGQRDDLQARQAALLSSNQLAETSKSELARLTRDLLDLEQALDGLRRLRSQQAPTYSLVPYRGQRGAGRMPIYVECTSAGLAFLPDGQRLSGLDLDLSHIRAEVERRHGPLVKAARANPFQPNPADQEPYVLFLIRPDGIGSYYRGQNALRGYQIDFGYELVDADWTLDVPSPSDWKMIAQAPAAPPNRPGVLRPPVAGLRLSTDPGATGQPVGPGGSGGPGGFSPVPGASGQSLGSGGNGGPGGFSPVPGASGQSLGSGGSGGPGGFSPVPVASGQPFGSGGNGGPGSAISGNNSGRSGPAGTGGPATNPGTAAARQPNANGPPGAAAGATIGFAPNDPMGSPPSNGGFGPPPGLSATTNDPAQPGSATTPTFRPAQPKSAAWSPLDGPAPGLKIPGAVAREDGAPPGDGNAKSPGAGSGSPAGREPPPSGNAMNRLALASPVDQKAPKAGPVSLSRVIGNRDFVVTIACYDQGAVLTPGGASFTWNSNANDDKSNEALVRAVVQLVQRRQATVRPGEPPYRAVLRFEVRDGGRRTYHRVFPLLEGLRLPMVREDVEE